MKQRTMRNSFSYAGLVRHLLVICTMLVLGFNSFAQCGCTFTINAGTGGVTFDGAANGVKPGDVICLQAGTGERIIFTNVRGSADRPVTIKNCGGQVLLGGPNANNGLIFQSSRYFRVTGSGSPGVEYGIKVTQTKSGTSGIQVTGLSSDVEIDHVEITRTGFAGIMAKTDPTSDCSNKSMVRPNFTMYNVKLHNNYIHNIGGEGIYVGNSYYSGTTVYCGSTQYPHEVRGVKIYDNLFDACGWESIQVGSAVQDVDVYNNRVLNYGTADKSAQNGAIQFGLGTSGRLYNNFIKGNPNGTGGQAIVIQGIGQNFVYNNVIVNSPDESITINARPTPLATDIVNRGWLGGTYIINNTIINPGKAAVADFINEAPGNVFYNNLIVLGRDPNWNKLKSSYDWKVANNIVLNSVSEARFANPGADDYSLQSGSPAVNAGRDVASFGVTKDYLGKGRPSGGSWDAGAFEFSGVNTPSPTPSPSPSPGVGTFYRAINLNGAAMVVDGNSWQASTSASGFSYTNGRTFANQSVTLQPATDATRSTMLRSSIWGHNVGLALSGVPAGTYNVYLHVWEDNSPEVYSISLEGRVVQSNFNSGTAGKWSKLGPFTASITDGTINVNTSGGAANLSGLEIWTQSSGGGNQPPVVSNPIVDQIATIGTPFTYTIPSNAFSDPNSGNVLTYTATLSNGSALPGWLSFNASTRAFSGTPTSGSNGVSDIRVTASDGNGGAASDVFTLTVNGSGGSGAFYRAINLNGTALVVDGRSWEASASAPRFSYTNAQTFTNQSVTLQPATDASRGTMIRSSIWGSNIGIAISGVPSGSYQVFLYVWEDNSPEVFSISLEGQVVQSNFNSGSAGSWRKLGPFTANVTDGTINVGARGGSANLSGIEIWSAPAQGASARLAIAESDSFLIEERDSTHIEFTAFPNPFSQVMNVSFTTEQSAATKLVMFDNRGTPLRTLYQANTEAGRTEHLQIESNNMPNGVYMLQLVNGSFIRHLKVVLLR